MKVLFISGDDYCALEFEKMFKGMTVEEVEKDLKNVMDRFAKEANYDYFSIEFKELNIDEEAFFAISEHIGDYDHMKTTTCLMGTI